MESNEGTLYYWCVRCGYNGKFSFRRSSQCKCETCEYDALTPYELDEILADEHLKFKFSEVLNENITISGS